MTEEVMENQPVDETTDPLAPTEETNATVAADGETTSTTVEDVDYKAELERAQKRLKKAEYTLDKLRAEKKEDQEIPDEESLVEKMWSKIDARLSERELKAQRQAYDKHIQSVASNEDEAALIKHHLENSIKPTGDVEEDIAMAKVLANKAKLVQTNKELARALKAKSTVQTAPNFNGAKMSVPEETDFTPDDEKLIKWADRYVGQRK